MRRLGRHVIITLCLATFGAALPARAAELRAPMGVRWGAQPGEAVAILARQYKFVGPQPPDGNPDEFLHEQRYAGDWLGHYSDHIAPLFYIGQLFAIAVSYSPTKEKPASQIWYALVERLTAMYGKPKSRTKPTQLVSRGAVLKLAPEHANKGELMALYNAADAPRELGHFLMLDLQVRTGGWVPEAVWHFDNGASVKAVMRAIGPDSSGVRYNLKPAVVYSKYDWFK